MKLCFYKALFISIFLLLLVKPILAQDFTAYSKQSILACPCVTFKDNFTIVNKENSPQEFSVSIEGDAKNFVVVKPENFKLLPRQRAILPIFITLPCDASGSYDFTVKIKTKSIIKAIKKTVIARDDCFNYTILSGRKINPTNKTKETKFFVEKEFPYQLCQQEPTIIPIYIKNDADYSNTFIFSIDAEDWISFPYNSVELQKNQAAVLFITIYPPDNLEGEFNISLFVTTKKGNVGKQKDISLELNNCYDPIIADALKRIRINYSSIKTILPLENTGIKNVTYSLAIEAENWTLIEPLNLFVAAGTEEKFFVQTIPGEDVKRGIYRATISATVKETDISYEKKLKIKLTRRFMPRLFRGIKNMFISIAKFFVTYKWFVIGGIIIIIVIVLLVVRKRKKKILPEEVAKVEKPPEYEFKERHFPWFYVIGFLILAGFIYFIYWLIRKIPWSKLWNWFIGVLSNYKWYIIGGIVVIVLGIIIMLIIKYLTIAVKKIKEKKLIQKKVKPLKKAVKKKAKKLVRKTKRIKVRYIILFIILAIFAFLAVYFRRYIGLYIMYIIIGLLLMIIIILGISIATRAKGVKRKKIPLLRYVIITIILLVVIGAGILYIMSLRFQIQPVKNVTEENITPILVEEEGIPTQRWYKNTEKKLRLDTYFYDPDKDQLSYTATKPQHVIVNIDNGVATFIPETDWIGTSSVIIIADDGKGGVIESKVTLIVEEPSVGIFKGRVSLAMNKFFAAVRDYIIEYYRYIITGFVVLIVIILLIKFHKPILDFFEEEEHVKKRKKL